MTVTAYAISVLLPADVPADYIGFFPPGCRFPLPPYYQWFDVYQDRWL